MSEMGIVTSFSLAGKNVLVTGGARRVGRILSLAVASAGGNVVVHYNTSSGEIDTLVSEIEALGVRAFPLRADFSDPQQTDQMIQHAAGFGPIYGLVNSAAIFEPLSVDDTSREDWQRHLEINLTAPFRLSQSYAVAYQLAETGRIVNILDWRALRPGGDYIPYTITKAGLAAMTHSLAIALAPRITVNGLALGAILPPSGQAVDEARILGNLPIRRWARPEELAQELLFLLAGPEYITGEVIYVDGGRHLV